MINYEMLPTEENLIATLKEDSLRRNKDICYFYDLLLAQEDATAIAIDGRWGSGKTFFVKQSMLVVNAKNPMSIMEEDKRKDILSKLPFEKKRVNESNSYLAVYYDAWENDNDMEPIKSIIYEISKQLGLTYSFEKNNIDVFNLAGSIIEIISGKNVNGILTNLKSEDPIAKFKEEKELSNKMKDFFSNITVEKGNRLVVFIDELDRCKPDFAVHLLEQIKHYMCDDRVTFVYSVNLEQLQHTIKSYYGVSFDACRYLDRFFNFVNGKP